MRVGMNVGPRGLNVKDGEKGGYEENLLNEYILVIKFPSRKHLESAALLQDSFFGRELTKILHRLIFGLASLPLSIDCGAAGLFPGRRIDKDFAASEFEFQPDFVFEPEEFRRTFRRRRNRPRKQRNQRHRTKHFLFDAQHQSYSLER